MQFTTSFVAAVSAILAITGQVAAAPTAQVEARDVGQSAITQKSAAAPNKLAIFELAWFFLGVISADTYGNMGQCYNLGSPYSEGVGSIDMKASDAKSCWVYPAADCNGDFTEVNKPGYSVYEGRVSSFKCVS